MQDETALSVPEAPDPAEPLVRELALLARGPGAAPSTELLTAYAAAAAPNSLRAFRADMLAFDAWCRHRRARTLPAEAATVAAFLTARAGQGVLQRHWPGTKHRSPGYTVCAASQIRPRTNWSSSHWQLSAETRTSKGNDGTTGATSTHRS